MRAKVGIIGAAGTLGSCAAFEIAARGIADELWLFDVNRSLLQSHAMDLQTAAAVVSGTSVHAAERLDDLAGCEVIVMAAGARWRQVSSRMELLKDNFAIIQSVAEEVGRSCPQAVVITATNPVDPLNHAFQLLSHMDRSQLIGYSLNDSYRFRMLAARFLGAATSRVEGFVLGEHGEHQVPLFSTLKLDKQAVEVTPKLEAWIHSETPKILKSYESLGTGRTSGWTSAVGLADLVRAVVEDSGGLFPCSAIVDGEYGRRGFSVGLPVRLGRRGVAEIQQWNLPPSEQERLEGAFDYLEENAKSLTGTAALAGANSGSRARH